MAECLEDASWIDSPPSSRGFTIELTPPGLAGFLLARDESYGKANLTRHLDNMAFQHRMSEREEEAAVLAMLSLSNSPRSKSAYEAAQALAIEVGTGRADDAGNTGQPLIGSLRKKATKAEAERIRKLEKARETEWIRTQRLATRLAQMKIIRSKTRLSSIHRIARKKIQWATFCALMEQIKHYAAHKNSENLDVAFFYLASFPGDGATYDCIYDFLRMVKDSNLDYVDTYIDLVTSPFIKEKSFFVDSDGRHHTLPVSSCSQSAIGSLKLGWWIVLG
jgi:hypothetical protein